MLNAEKARKASERAQERKLFAKAEVYIRKAMAKGWTMTHIPPTLGEVLTRCSLLGTRGFILDVHESAQGSKSYHINW